MSDKRFEKQVQQKLNELRLRPSDTVWSGVEKELRKKKRRRLLWVLPIFLFVGLAYWYFNSESDIVQSTPAVPRSNQSRDVLVDQPKNPSDEYASSPKNDVRTPHKSEKKTDLRNIERGSAANRFPTQKSGKRNIKKREQLLSTSRGTQEILQDDHTTRELPKKSRDLDLHLTKDTPEAVDHGDQNISSRAKEDTGRISFTSPPSKESPEARLMPDTVTSTKADSVAKKSDTVEISKSADSAVVLQKPRLPRRSWQWGLAAGVGRSGLRNGNLFNMQKSAVMDYSSGASGLPPVFASPSPVHDHTAYHVGLFTRRSSSRRIFSYSVGIQYAYHSNYIYVGEYVDSTQLVSQGAFGLETVFGFYRASAFGPAPVRKKYTNQYHFVNLPVQLDVRLTNPRAVPIYLHGGVSFSLLASTNALHFDGGRNVYYNDGRLFNRAQLFIDLGIMATLFKSHQIPVQVGPSVQYGVMNLMKDSRNRLFGVSMSGRVYLKK